MKTIYRLTRVTAYSLLLFAFVPCASFAQDAPDFEEPTYGEIKPKHQFSLSLGLPNGTSNKPFSSILQGLVHTSPYYQFTTESHLAIGVGVNYAYFKINPVRVPEPVKGALHHTGVYLKVGYEKFYSERFGMEYALKVGYNQNFFASDTNRVNLGKAVVESGVMFEPMVSLVLTADEWSSFRFFVAYNFSGTSFDLSDIGVKTKDGYLPAEFERRTQFATFGFGYTYYFKQY
jgi:hypothetical protein